MCSLGGWRSFAGRFGFGVCGWSCFTGVGCSRLFKADLDGPETAGLNDGVGNPVARGAELDGAGLRVGLTVVGASNASKAKPAGELSFALFLAAVCHSMRPPHHGAHSDEPAWHLQQGVCGSHCHPRRT